jgi:hypothetical protein
MSSTYDVEIQPYSIQYNIVKIKFYMNYIFNATDCNVSVQLIDDTDRILDAKYVHIPPEIYSQWTDDDSVILNYIYEQLNMTPKQNS